MTPPQAEAEALRLGIKPFVSEPHPAKFDPMRETWWSLPMAIAWIAWRSPDRVREFWDAYRSECWDWNFREWRDGPDGPVYAGHFLEQRRPATLSSLLFAEHHDSAQGLLPDRATSISDAKAKLWEALSENSFQATGVTTDTGERTIIPDYAWRDLHDIEERGRDALRVREASGVWTGRGYDDVACGGKISWRSGNLIALKNRNTSCQHSSNLKGLATCRSISPPNGLRPAGAPSRSIRAICRCGRMPLRNCCLESRQTS
jgi:hypothetical protein